MFRFRHLRPFFQQSAPPVCNWEQLLLVYFFMLRDYISVRYILKKQGQGWSTIFVLSKAKDFSAIPPGADATPLAKQEFAINLVERLQFRDDTA